MVLACAFLGGCPGDWRVRNLYGSDRRRAGHLESNAKPVSTHGEPRRRSTEVSIDDTARLVGYFVWL